MRVMVTGGAGFIGSAVIRHLLHDLHHEVVNVDKLTYAANLENLNSVLPSPRYCLEQIDIADAPAVAAAIARHQPDCIMHLAAELHVDRSIDGPAEFIRTNIVGTYVLLDAARAYWQSLPTERRERFRFHHVSTDEVFGSLSGEGTFTEATPYAPNSPYSASKASSDMLARAWYRTFGLPVVTSNCSNNYGPFQFPEKLIPVVILNALAGRGIPVYGAGVNVRDWLYVEDHARALYLVLTQGRIGETYNIGGNAELSNLDLVRTLCSILDDVLPKSAHRPHHNLIKFVDDRPGHDLRYAIDASKIAGELGWHPSIGLEEGMRRTVIWYLENKAWWEGILQRGFKGERIGLKVAAVP